MSDTAQSDSIRDTLTAAFDQQEKPEAVPETSATTAQPAVVETPAQARSRDETGRFAPKPVKPVEVKAPEAAPAQVEQKVEPVPQPTETAPVEKAPQSWTPAAREEWAKVPPAVRQQVMKREQEVSRLLNETTGVRKAHQEFEATLAPYKDMLTGPPAQVVGNLLQTAAVLHRGSAVDKAALVASIMRGYGVSPDAVADALEGKAPATQQPPPYRDPRVDELLQRQQQQDQQAQQATMAEVQSALQAFEATNPEFLNDVRDDMLVLLETNRAKTYDEAYRKACAMSEEVGKVLKQRQEQQRQTAQAATVRAKNASSSVRHEPAAPGTGAQPNSIRGALEAAFATHSGR